MLQNVSIAIYLPFVSNDTILDILMIQLIQMKNNISSKQLNYFKALDMRQIDDKRI